MLGYECPSKNNVIDEAMNIEIQRPFIPSMRLYALVTPAIQTTARTELRSPRFIGITTRDEAAM